MPAAYNKINPRSRLDQLIDYMKAHSSVPILDVRQDLRAAKQAGRVYDLTDSHWNRRGGYVAYSASCRRFGQALPEAKAIPRSDFHEFVERGPGGDLADARHP